MPNQLLDHELSEVQPTANGHAKLGIEYSHILIPVRLEQHEITAMTLGFQLAAAHDAKVTLLYVLPQRETPSSSHWLDGIARLHAEGATPNGNGHLQDERPSLDRARREVIAFLHNELPVRLCERVAHSVKFLTGDIAEEVAQFAAETDVDLVVLSTGGSNRCLPVLPRHVRQLLRRSHRQVVLVRPHNDKGNSWPSTEIERGRNS